MRKLVKISIALGAVAALTVGGVAIAENAKTHNVPPSPDGNLVVALCDGVTTAEVPGVKAGSTLSKPQAQEVSDRLMNAWKAKNPGASWDEAPKVAANTANTATTNAPNATPAAANGTVAPSGGNAQQGGVPQNVNPARQDGQTYGGYTKRDEELWKASADAFIQQGNDIFHDASKLGGTIGVSCDMCHPNAANTHPETYPKYQVQLGKVALLRDMINWCIENPVRGKPLADDDPKLKAMEAYILAQRKGVALEYGKH